MFKNFGGNQCVGSHELVINAQTDPKELLQALLDTLSEELGDELIEDVKAAIARKIEQS